MQTKAAESTRALVTSARICVVIETAESVEKFTTVAIP